MCFSGERRWSAGLGGGPKLLDVQLHSTNMETRGSCLCVYTGGRCLHALVFHLTSFELQITCPDLPTLLPARCISLFTAQILQQFAAASTALYYRAYQISPILSRTELQPAASPHVSCQKGAVVSGLACQRDHSLL